MKLGDKIYTRIDQEPWLVHSITGGKVKLIRTCQEKVVKANGLMYRYTRVGSARHVNFLESCRRHQRKVWEGYNA